ncbi:response regulator [Flaviaesturariibacter amylovorans]|uniref:Response regulator n=1 Tax=Flaviaesturariibacter amylovorans TaxID=1084520 RepID=A0ABP8HCT3_9BACT
MSKVINILMVEDDPLDVMDIRRTLDKMKIVYHLHHARNGEEGLRLLGQLAGEEPSVQPDIALIDINMPKMNGLEFLQALRADERWKGLRCFIITTSDEPFDRQSAKALGVSGYIVKPFKVNNPSSMDSFNLMIDLMNMRG